MKKYINLNKKISNLENTYMEKYTQKIIYFSDSANNFRFGDPTKTSAFKKSLNIQLLLHPIWWQTKFRSSSNQVINKLFFDKRKYLDAHISKNIFFYNRKYDK